MGIAVPFIRQPDALTPPLRPIVASTRVAREVSPTGVRLSGRDSSMSREDPEIGQLRGVLAERELLVGELERQIASLRQQLTETESRLGRDVSDRDQQIAGQAQLIEELQQLSGQGGNYAESEIFRLRQTVEEQAAKIVQLERSRMGDSEYAAMQANGAMLEARGAEQQVDGLPMDVVVTEDFVPESTDASALTLEKGQTLTVISTSGQWATVKTQQGRAGVVPLHCLGLQETGVQSGVQGGMAGMSGAPAQPLQGGFLAGMSGAPAQPLPPSDLQGGFAQGGMSGGVDRLTSLQEQAGVSAGMPSMPTAPAEEVLPPAPAPVEVRPAVMTGFSGDQIDRTLQEWFAGHRDFQVDIDKVKPGWYMFGPPISAKHYMKMAGAQVVVRVGGGFKNLIKYLNEQRRDYTEAEDMEVDVQAVRRATQAQAKRKSSTGRRSRGGSAGPSARPSAR